MTLGPDNPPPPSSAQPLTPSPADPAPATDSAPAAETQADRNWVRIGAGALGLVVLGGVLSAAVLPRLVQAVPALGAVFPGAADADLIDELSAELAAQDNIMTTLRRRLEAQTSRVAALSDETAAQSSTLADLESRVGALEGGGGAKTGGGNSNRIEMLSQRLGQLESAFVPLSERATKAIESARSQKEILAEQAQMTSALSALEERLQTLERSAAGDRRGTLIALSFAALREIANRGRPFAAEFEALTGLLADSNLPELAGELQGVAPYAPSGAPSFGSLRTSFDEAAAAILHAAAIPEGANWWQRALAEFKSLVTIRPTGEVAGADPAAIVARAERRLNQNDLAGAVQELKGLPKPAAAAAVPWLRGAEARLAVDDALARFASVLIHATARGSEPQAPDASAPAPAKPETRPGRKPALPLGVSPDGGA